MRRNLCRFVFVLALSAGLSAAGFSQTTPAEQASFQIKNVFTVHVPKGAHSLRIWFAVPQQDAYSEIDNFRAASDLPVHYGFDSSGNKVGYAEALNPTQDKIVIQETFGLKRAEVHAIVDPARTRPLTDKERAAMERYLLPSTYVVVNGDIKKLAESITGGETNPIRAARKLYDWTYQNINYWVKDPDQLKASPVGSSDYCLRTKTGNCTDFHSLFSALAMAVGIPNRMVYGSLLKPTLNGFDVDASYHCWIEFFAPQIGWIPLDASLANIYWGDTPITEKNKKLIELTTSTGYHGPDPVKINFYFGNLDDRRVVWSIGRDLMMQPAQDDGPVNSFPKMYVEVDGKQYTNWDRVFTYKQ